MNSAIYKSTRKPDCYLYIERPNDFARVPASLLAMLGELEFVMEVTLGAERKLAQPDPLVVMAQLQERGFYLQMPRTFYRIST